MKNTKLALIAYSISFSLVIMGCSKIEQPLSNTNNWNFMVGTCTYTSSNDMTLKSCDVEALRNVTFLGEASPGVMYTKFDANEVVSVFVEPTAFIDFSKQQGVNIPVMPDQIIKRTASYSKGSDDNSVIVTTQQTDGCKINWLYRKSGDQLTSEVQNYEGCNNQDQVVALNLAINNQKQNGPSIEKVVYFGN